MILDRYVHNENSKYETLYDLQYDGQITQAEIDARAPIFEERVSMYEFLNRQSKIFKDHFYLVVYDKDREILNRYFDLIEKYFDEFCALAQWDHRQYLDE